MGKLDKLKSYLPRGEFSKNVLTLMTGTTIAQAIPIAISPILTRLYTPEDFGLFAVFLSLTAITGVISNATYERAIVLAIDEDDAINIVYMGFFISLFSFILTLIAVFFFGHEIALLLNDEKVEPWLYFVPFSILFLGIYKSLSYYNIRCKKFKNISESLVSKSTALAFTQVAGGLLKIGAFGLIGGLLMSYLLGNSVLFRTLNKRKAHLSVVKKERMIFLAKKYKKFPIYSMPAIFLNSINLNIVNFLIPSNFSISILGFYAFTQRIIGIPTSVIGVSFSQVYFQQASKVFQEHGNTQLIFIKTLKKLILIALPLFLILFFISEPLFAFVFGEKWRVAGTYAVILSPFAFFRFLSSSLATTITIHEKQQVGLIINIILVLTTISIFKFGENYTFRKVLAYYSTCMSINYILFLSYYYYLSKQDSN